MENALGASANPVPGLSQCKISFGGLNVSTAWKLLEQRYVVGWKVEVDLSHWVAGKLGKFFVGHTLEECLGDVGREHWPLVPHCFGS